MDVRMVLLLSSVLVALVAAGAHKAQALISPEGEMTEDGVGRL